MSAEILQMLDIPVQVNSIHCLAWSQHNRFAMSTRQGIYVFNLMPDPFSTHHQMNFSKDLITVVPNETPPSIEDYISDKLSSMPLELKNVILQDKVLCPFMKPNEDFSFPKFVGWTPLLNLAKRSSEQYLVSLSHDYSFRFYGASKGQWSCVVDLSKILNTYIDKNTKLLKKYCRERLKDTTCDKFIKKAYLFGTLCISWFDDKSFVTGQEGGQIIFWSTRAGKVSITKILQPELGAVTSILVQNLNDGRKLIYLGTSKGKVVILSGTDFKKKTHIWEEADYLKVTKLLHFPAKSSLAPGDNTIPENAENNSTKRTLEDAEPWEIVLCKSNFVIKLEIQCQDNEFKVAEKSWFNAGVSHVLGVEQHIDHGAVKGLQGDDSISAKFLTVAQKGPIYIWDGVESNPRELELKLERRDHQAWGFCSSPNKAVYCLLESVSSFHDHLTLRIPSRLTFFTLTPPANIRYNLEKLEFGADYLELFRIASVKNRTTSLDLERIDNLHSRWWLSTVLLNSSYTGPSQAKEIALHANVVEKVLRCDAAVTVLLSENYSDYSKFHAAKFLVKYCDDPEAKAEADQIVKTLASNSWRCSICGYGLKKESFKAVLCHSNHRWGRCGLTQQPCDDRSYLTCQCCGALYKDLDAHTPTECSLCRGNIM